MGAWRRLFGTSSGETIVLRLRIRAQLGSGLGVLTVVELTRVVQPWPRFLGVCQEQQQVSVAGLGEHGVHSC